ncbi:MAG TPA: hypothetical protein VN281_03495, partial [Verrucomicrobiae bacterium]|nr:hypothetical protein [Verrucomicrobiae bacterium]
PAVAIIASYWTALNFAWFIGAVSSRMQRNREVLIGSIGWCLLAFPLMAAFIRFLGWESAGYVTLLCLLPLVQIGSNIPAEPELVPPSYARAIAKMKFGKYAEAESEVIQELDRCANDFDGWMLLAELYANHFHDLREADRTIRELATEPKTTPSQIGVAFHRLADWHLKLGGDPVAARVALEAIITLLPGTHLAHMAQLRINQLPATREAFEEQKEKGRTFRLPALSDSLDDIGASAIPAIDPGEAARRVNDCVHKLRQNPNDVTAREELARLLAAQTGKASAGIEQLRLLLNMPNQPDQKRVEWLALIASWQLHYLQDETASRATLEDLVHNYAESPQAFAAQRRLSQMDAEDRVRRMKAAANRIRLPTR